MTYEKEVSIYKPNATADGIADAATSATDYLYETGSGDLIQAPDAPSTEAEAVSMQGYYTKIVTTGPDAGFDVYEGGGVLSQKRVAHYGTEAVIGAEDEAHVTIGASRMYFSDGDDSVFFAGDSAEGAASRTVVLVMNTKSQDPAGGAGDEFWIEHPDGYWAEYGETPIESITSVEVLSEDDSVAPIVLPTAQYNIEYTTRDGKNYLKKVTVIDPDYDIESEDEYVPFWITHPVIRITALTSAPNVMYHMQEEPENSVGDEGEAGYGVAESNSTALGLRSHAASGGTAIAPGSWAIGPGVVSEFPNSLVIGKNNKRGARNLFAIGNGTDDTEEGRSDAFSVTPEGRVLTNAIEFNGAYEDISDSISVNDEYIGQPSSNNLIVYRLGCFVQVYVVFSSVYNGNIPHAEPLMYGFPKPLFPMTVVMGTNTSRACPTVIRIDEDGTLSEWYGQYIQNGNTVRAGFMYLCAEDA